MVTTIGRTINLARKVARAGVSRFNSEWRDHREVVLLTTFSSQIQATKVIVILDVLSNHSPDEEYLGNIAEASWKEDPVINAVFERFNGRLKELEGNVDDRNSNSDLKNRNGAGTVPYELLKPFSEPGVIGKGVPYNISI
ncbi:hypothetical protein ACOSP7_017344 [Xanthoceras sorbifolium]